MKRNIITTVVFVLFLFTMSTLCIFMPSNAFSDSERRELASLPTPTKESVADGTFMQDFETYSTERIPFRESFRTIKAWISTNVFRKMDNNGVFVTEGHISKIDSQMNEEMMDYAANKFKSVTKKFLEDKNMNLYFSVVPDKNFVLANKNGYPSLNYNEFIAKMKNKVSYMEYIDITKLLDKDDYYTTDTHWRQEKILDVAEKLANAMKTDVKSEYEINTLDIPFSGVYTGQLAIPFKADTINYLTNETLENVIVSYYDESGILKQGEMYNMEKAKGKDPYEMFLSGSMPVVILQNPNAKTDKELYLFRDSFGSSLAPLMAEGYSKITVIDIRYVKSDFLGAFVDFKENSDCLFIYSTALLNNSLALQ